MKQGTKWSWEVVCSGIHRRGHESLLVCVCVCSLSRRLYSGRLVPPLLLNSSPSRRRSGAYTLNSAGNRWKLAFWKRYTHTHSHTHTNMADSTHTQRGGGVCVSVCVCVWGGAVHQ